MVVWGPVDSLLRRVWSGIAQFLSSLWQNIWDLAKRVWDGITDTLRRFVGWAEANIPGVKKLLSLDDAWRSAKQYEEQTRRVDVAVKATTASMASAGRAGQSLSSSIRTLETGTRSLTSSTDRARASIAATEKATNGLRAATQYLAQSEAIRRLEQQWFGVFETTERVRTQGLDSVLRAWQQEAMRTVPEIEKVGGSIKDLGSNLRILGTQSTATFDASLQGIRQFGNALPELPAGLKRAMDESFDHISRRTKATADEQSRLWQTLNRQVSTIITDLGKGIADVIMSGKSLQDVFVGALREIGNAVIRLVTEQLAGMLVKILRDLITGHLPDLVGAFKKAIGAIVDLFADLSKSVSDVSRQVSGIGGAAGGAAGGAGAGGGAAAGGATGWVNMVTGIVSAVTDIFGLFGQRRMEQDIARIEISTRGSLNQLIALQHSANEWWPWMREATEVLWKIFGAVAGTEHVGAVMSEELARNAASAARAIDKYTESVKDLTDATKEYAGILDDARNALRRLGDAAASAASRLADTVDAAFDAVVGAADRLLSATSRTVSAMTAAAQNLPTARAQSGPIVIRFEGMSTRDQEFAQAVIEQFIRQAKATGQLV
jgi:hypothetical protein